MVFWEPFLHSTKRWSSKEDVKSSTEGGVCSWTIVRPQFLHFGQITLIINHSFKAANHTKRHFHSNSARPYIQQCGVQLFMNRGYITCIAESHTILHICVFLFSILGNAVNTKHGNSMRHMIKTKYQTSEAQKHSSSKLRSGMALWYGF